MVEETDEGGDGGTWERKYGEVWDWGGFRNFPFFPFLFSKFLIIKN